MSQGLLMDAPPHVKWSVNCRFRARCHCCHSPALHLQTRRAFVVQPWCDGHHALVHVPVVLDAGLAVARLHAYGVGRGSLCCGNLLGAGVLASALGTLPTLQRCPVALAADSPVVALLMGPVRGRAHTRL